ncbi:chemotaxis protein CheB [Telluribacter sp. SYSU D00476]|uniref:chemotaxis protein CheB n=1 Tax=Telluribacter sp. SYSU D00476 TaxID=2811430 RepID=UPI001FF4B995|nr:chemotaxis protein CheB [Telluribacter sp. SYSU D00476]
MDDQPQYVIVVGASAGGLKALQELVVQIQEGTEAAIFVVLHLSKRGIGELLTYRLQQHTQLPCQVAADGMPIRKGHVYVAPPDHHLIVKQGIIRIVNGAAENRWRPSIDVMFRSAAVAYGERAIGIILTGMLDDGTAGMLAISRCGGTCIVQDPNEAEYPDMPLSVVTNMEVDYCVPLTQIGFVLYNVMKTKEIKGIPIPPDLRKEAEIAEKVVTKIEDTTQLGTQSTYVCPDCGGVLSELKDDGFSRYRCHTGHVFTEGDLLTLKTEEIESTLWVALRIMEEKRNLLAKLAEEEIRKGLNIIAIEHRRRADELGVHISKIKEVIFRSATDDE